MGLLDINECDFDTPVTKEWLMSKGFQEYDVTDDRKASPEIVYVYWWKSYIEVSIKQNYVRYSIQNPKYGTTKHPDGRTTVDYRPRIKVVNELETKGQIISLMESYKNEHF